ncbi:putative ribonuclease H-like domain-containing protein, partial [Tanacetum coccineum]
MCDEYRFLYQWIPNKSRKGVGFVSDNVVPPPPTGLFSPPKLDLSNSGLEEFQRPEFESYGPKTSKSVSKDISNEVRKSPDAPLVEELVSDDKLEKKIVFPTVAKIEFVRAKQQEKPVSKPANCNYHQRERVVSGNNYTRVNYNYSTKKAHLRAHRNMAPRTVLMKTGLRPLNTVRPVNTAHLKTTVYSARPMSFNTAKGNFYTGSLKAVNTARPNSAIVNVVKANQTSKNLMEDMLLLGEEPNEEELLVKELLKLILLKVHRKNNMYSVDIKNIIPKERFTWVFFLATKDETIGILKNFITEIENLVNKKVKIIRCDNGTESKNRVMIEFYEKKGIKREFSVARTP